MKALAVCGFGVGSSMVLKMSLEKVCSELGVPIEVENTDINFARACSDCDVVFTSEGIAREIASGINAPVYAVKKYVDSKEIKAVVQKWLDDIEYQK